MSLATVRFYGRTRACGAVVALFTVMLHVSQASASPWLYTGPIDVVEATIDIDADQVATVTSIFMLRNNSAQAQNVAVDFALRTEAEILAGSPGAFSLLPGEQITAEVSYVLPVDGALDLRGLLIRPGLWLDGKGFGKRASSFRQILRLPPGVDRLLSYERPPSNTYDQGGRTVIEWQQDHAPMLSLRARWTVGDAKLALQKSATTLRTTADQQIAVELRVENTGTTGVANIELFDTYDYSQFRPGAPAEDFVVTEASPGRGFNWFKRIAQLAPGQQRTFSFTVTANGARDVRLPAATALVRGSAAAHSNPVLVESRFCGDHDCEDSETHLTCPADCDWPGDADKDGVADGVDNCPQVGNPTQTNFDADALGDACDSDRDGDGVYHLDNCGRVPNPNQEDEDQDGVGNPCDNCPGVVSASRLDRDGDGVGDACDPDDDGDGAVDTVDNCPLLPNGDQADLDGDQLGDACDQDIDGDGLWDLNEADYGTDPYDPDSDDDLVPDGFETDRGTDPADPDTDDDGIPDGQDPDTLRFLFQGRLCARGALDVRNNAVISGPGVSSGLFTDGHLVVANNAQVLGSAYAGCGVEIGNNGLVSGDVYYSGSLNLAANAEIQGEEVALACDLCATDRITAPCNGRFDFSALWALANAAVGPSHGVLASEVPPGALDADSRLSLVNNAAATVPGRLYAVRAVELSNNAQLSTSGDLAVFLVLESLVIENNVQLGSEAGQIAFLVFGDAQIELGNNVTAHGALIAPWAELTILSNNVRFEGALDVAALRLANNNEVVISAPGATVDPARLCFP